MRRFALGLDLVNDPTLIAEYEAYHQAVWPAIVASIKEAGIEAMEIYRFENRLFMLMEVKDSFSFDQKGEMDANNEEVQRWEALMWKYQQAIPGAKEGEKWVLMDKIFAL